MCHYWRSVFDWGSSYEYQYKCNIQMHIPKQLRLKPKTHNIQQISQTHRIKLTLKLALNIPQIKQLPPKTKSSMDKQRSIQITSYTKILIIKKRRSEITKNI